MARGVNKVILIGHLGKDPEIRNTNTGGVVATLSLATTSPIKNADGQWDEQTEWHRVVFFERTAEVVQQYLHKGSQIYVEGRLRTRKWQDKQGNDRYTTEVVGREMQMLGGRGDNNGGGYEQPSQPQARGRSNLPAMPDDFDDKVPF